MIKIREGTWSTSFMADFDIPHQWESCEICNFYDLDSVYVYIIESLRKAGLLPSDYKKICCSCFLIKEKMGGNYHKGCNRPLRIKTIGPYTAEILCRECGTIVGIVNDVGNGELVGSKYFEVVERLE